VFGVSFTEVMLIGVVALLVVGPQRLPGMMSTVGKWSNKLRRMLFDVRAQSGIDDILRAEGITGGINEIRALRNAVRTNVSSFTQTLATGPRPPAGTSSPKPPTPAVSPPPVAQTPLAAESDAFAHVPYDRTREYPDEGCDAYGAIPEDLWNRSRRPVAVAQPLPDATDGTDAAVVAAASAIVEATSDVRKVAQPEAVVAAATPHPSDAPTTPEPEVEPGAASATLDVGTAATSSLSEPSSAPPQAATAEAQPGGSTVAVPPSQPIAQLPTAQLPTAQLPTVESPLGVLEASTATVEAATHSPLAVAEPASPRELSGESPMITSDAESAERSPNAPATETDVSQEPSVKVTVP
jgi:sec-independent protein translocase protein TatB